MVVKNQKMKKLIPLIMALAMFWACGEDKPITPVEPETSLTEQIIGDWHYTSTEADIYLGISSDSSFELYQKIGDGRYRLYRGTWNLDETSAKLTGKYNDGESWGSGYTVSISEDGTMMNLVPDTGSKEQQYISESIPEEVRTGCEVVVKSVEAGL